MDSNFLFKISFEALGSHILRTLLTMLGVIIGVAAVVAMMSIGEGAKQEALEQISILGINNVIVNAKVPQLELGANTGLQFSDGLTIADGNNIGQFDELIENVVPQRFENIRKIYHYSNETEARVVSTTPQYIYSSSVEVERGRFITDMDMEDFSQVCVLGAHAKKELFAFSNPIGEIVRVGDLEFTVVGIMADKYIGRGKVEGLELKNLNEDVYIPLSTAQKKIEREWILERNNNDEEEEIKYNIPEIDQLTISVTNLEYVQAATHLIESILARRHGGVDDYDIIVPESLLRQTEKTQQIFNMVMVAIASLSLLVGGIGIMNIMLASVLERTREIGVRRAVGARRTDILKQFLIEAVTICLLGCIIGISLGLFISRGISLYAGWPTVVSIFSIILAVGVSTIVGIGFGMYPAHKASKIDIIEALRFE
ncbi:MAG: FtsX-like permease family protein [candidate division Zixibacteria bacterium]|nr:FtsX-like permease family protein [candidate division Zixibacteria bacterium]